MNRYLSLSQAARLAGVSRRTLQRQIQAGDLETFEGRVAVAALTRLYPQIAPEDNAVLERVARLRERATAKYDLNHLPSEARLVEDLNRLSLALDDAYAEIEAYRDLCAELRTRLEAIQAQCGHDQRMVLHALLAWMLRRLEKRAR